MRKVRGVHALKAGGVLHEPGEIVEIEDDLEAADLVRRGAAAWPEPELDELAEDAGGEGGDGREGDGEEGDGGQQVSLPANFPGRAEFIAAGITSVAAVAALPNVTIVDGIGPKTAAAVKKYLESASTGA